MSYTWPPGRSDPERGPYEPPIPHPRSPSLYVGAVLGLSLLLLLLSLLPLFAVQG